MPNPILLWWQLTPIAEYLRKERIGISWHTILSTFKYMLGNWEYNSLIYALHLHHSILWGILPF